jgi:hypothetical protein
MPQAPPEGTTSIGEFLGSLPLFAGLNRARLDALAQEC